MGLVTIVFILIVTILTFTLPLSKSVPKDINDQNKDVNNFNPAFDQNNFNLIQQLNQDQNKAYLDCVNMCKEYKNTISYENGPCLSDAFGFKVKTWACDLAHNPRTAEDNDPKNQCKSYISGEAKYFVELDTNCNILR